MRAGPRVGGFAVIPLQSELRAAALDWHIARGSSPALISLHLHGFVAGGMGRSVRSCPFYAEPPATSIHLHEWLMAHAAGVVFARGLVPELVLEEAPA